MANNIINLQEAIAQRAKENAELAAETFNPDDTQLTPEEMEKAKEMARELNGKSELVVTETTPEGVSSTIPVETYMENIDKQVKEIRDSAGNFVAKGLNVGDIKKTAEEMKKDAQEQAIKAFREQARDSIDVDISDEEIIRINNSAIEAIQKYLKTDRLNSDDIIKAFRRLSLRQISEIIPAEFMQIYVSEKEILANSLPGKERLLSTLAYLSVTGPEMDYLNDYIDHEHKLMMLSHRLIECQLNMADVLKSRESLIDIVKKANELAPRNPDSPWSKYIKGDSQRIHSEFAQKAVVASMIKDSYANLLKEYEDDPECVAEIQEQIDESETKRQIYLRITNLELLHELWDTLVVRLKMDRRGSYKNLEREAISAMDRIRRAKQNVSFPIYSDGTPGKNKPEVLYKMYITQYPTLLKACNETICAVYEKVGNDPVDMADIEPIEIEGLDEQAVLEMYAMMLLILFGRVMKKLSPNEQTKYQAIELDLYFELYCKLVTDVYLMNDVWKMMKDFVEYAVKTWPKGKGK